MNAMTCLLTKFDVYINHLATIIEDSSTKALDKTKLKGCYIEWTNAKYLLQNAMFADLLTLCATFSKSMQNSKLNLLAAITFLLRTMEETDNLNSKSLEQWPVYTSTFHKLTKEDGHKNVYQPKKLMNLKEVKKCV